MTVTYPDQSVLVQHADGTRFWSEVQQDADLVVRIEQHSYVPVMMYRDVGLTVVDLPFGTEVKVDWQHAAVSVEKVECLLRVLCC